MKMMRFITLITIFATYCCFPVSAQLTIKEILKIYSDSPIPHPTLHPNYTWYAFKHTPGEIPNKLYKNIQCTESDFADDEDTSASVYAKFKLPQQNTTLIAINFGGMTEMQTDVLVSVDSDGNILDALEVAVGYVYIKQYRILADGQIIVTTIKPKQEASILFENFNSSDSFVGNRIDCTYIVEKGKFVLKKEQKYADKTYTYELLSDYNYRLWDGDEQLLNE